MLKLLKSGLGFIKPFRKLGKVHCPAIDQHTLGLWGEEKLFPDMGFIGKGDAGVIGQFLFQFTQRPDLIRFFLCLPFNSTQRLSSHQKFPLGCVRNVRYL